MADKKTYVFKPQKALTLWALWLMGIEIFGLVCWAGGQIMAMLEGGHASPITALVLLVGIFVSVATMIASGVVNLCWVYGACRNAHVLRPGGVTTSPGWAVGWFFVPIASLWKPFQALRETWDASVGPVNGRYVGSPLIITWWASFLGGNLVMRFSGSDSGGEDGLTYVSSVANWANVAGLALIAMSTVCFFMMVRTINRNQLTADLRVADTF